MRKRLEIKAGDKFGKWTVLEEAEPVISSNGYPIRRLKCRCECGITYKAFYNRVTKYGWDLETAIHCKTRKRKIHNTKRTKEVNGVSLIDLYDRECDCGITYKSFYNRVRKGWDVQTALHKVTRKSRRGEK